MHTYSFLRELADSWVLLAMMVFFIGTCLWAFRPGSRAVHDDVAAIPFRNETAPGAAAQPAHAAAFCGDGGTCGCGGDARRRATLTPDSGETA